jgi:uncharacterized protein (DUF934 family)
MSEPAPLLAPLKPASTTPRLWNGKAFVADPWRTLSDEEPFPIGGHAIVSLARWRAEQAALIETGAAVGVLAQPADTIDPATDDIARLAVIALVFPKFTDGRAYSTARRLREAGFAGEIRATGDVLLDQLPLMLRAGFNAFEITHAATVRALEAAPIPAVSRVYQSDAAINAESWRSRRKAAAAQGCRQR